MTAKNNSHTDVNLKLSLNSDKKIVDKVICIAVNLISFSSASNNFLTIILPLALDELLRNAIQHGNKNDESKLVKVKIFWKKAVLKLEIEDEGNGFEYLKELEKNGSRDLYTEHGRGLQIIQSYSKEMLFAKNGSKVIVSFDIN